MSKADGFENSLLQLLFNGTAIVGIAQNHSSPYADLYVGLYVGDPGEAGNQSSNECAYTNYGRKAVSRNAAGWTISGNNVSNAGAISFNQCGATGNTVTHVGIGSNATGGGNLFYSGALGSNLVVSNGVTPSFGIGNLVVSED